MTGTRALYRLPWRHDEVIIDCGRVRSGGGGQGRCALVGLDRRATSSRASASQQPQQVVQWVRACTSSKV
jgi:hypothetical protein